MLFLGPLFTQTSLCCDSSPLCSLKLRMGLLAGELRVATDRKRKKVDKIAFDLQSKSVVSARFQHSTPHSSGIIQQSTIGATFGLGNGNKALAKAAVRCLLLALKAKRKGWRKGHQTPCGCQNVPKGRTVSSEGARQF